VRVDETAIGMRNDLRDSLCESNCERNGDGTTRFAAGVVGGPGDDQGSANCYYTVR
jgi:hypothetical protein